MRPQWEHALATYSHLAALLETADHEGRRWDDVVAYLLDVWAEDYRVTTGEADLIETDAGGFSYLFDLNAERLLAAWGVSRGRNMATRDAARMAGHPKAGGDDYHRGHAISHGMGGGTDINLVPQLGSMNVGAFRQLERKAVTTPGAFYFTYWIYAGAAPVRDGPSQIPTGVDQGLLIFGQPPEVRHLANR